MLNLGHLSERIGIFIHCRSKHPSSHVRTLSFLETSHRIANLVWEGGSLLVIVEYYDASCFLVGSKSNRIWPRSRDGRQLNYLH